MSELSEPDKANDDEPLMEALGRETAIWKSYCLTFENDRPDPDEAPLRTLSEELDLWPSHNLADTMNETVLEHLLRLNQTMVQISYFRTVHIANDPNS